MLNIFIVSGEAKDVEMYDRFVYKAKKANFVNEKDIIVFYQQSSFLTLLENFAIDTQYRLWVHVGLKDNEKQPKDTTKEDLLSYYDLKTLVEKGINFNLVTRLNDNNNNISDLQKWINTNFSGTQFPIPLFNITEVLEQKLCPMGVIDNQHKEKWIKCDIVVINAIQAEFDAIKKVFEIDTKNSIPFYSHSLNVKEYQAANGIKKQVAFILQDKMGMVDAGILTTYIINNLKPSVIVMTGVCGGKPDSKSINYGDIIIPSQVFTFQFGKITDGDIEGETEFQADLQIEKVDKLKSKYNQKVDDLTSKVKGYVSTNIELQKTIINHNALQKVTGLSELEISVENLQVHVGSDLACSTSVIDAHGAFKNEISDRSRNAIAVEMESYGIARACELSDSDVKPLIMKSIMDKTQGKSDSFKEYASYTSAYLLKAMLEDCDL